MGAQTLLLPVAGVALLWVAGLGAAELLAPRMAPEARAALAAPVAAGVLVCASPLALAHVRPGILAAAVLVCLGAVTFVRRHSLAKVMRAAKWPLVIAAFALVINAAPALRNGNWVATSFGNADPYLWASQAKSLDARPPPAPAASFPDRVSYELMTKDHWPEGLPVALGAVADLGRLDPARAYEAFAAIISTLLALGVFVVARGSLMWSTRFSALAAMLIAANGLMLLSTYFGWQAQLLLTGFGTLGALTVPVCMDRRAASWEAALPALFLAAGIATYGWVFAPFLLVTGVVAFACWLQSPRSSIGRRQIVRRFGVVAGLTLILGLLPTIDALRRYLVARGRFDASVLHTWSNYDWAYPSDALGLIIRVGTQRSPGVGWTAFAIAVAAVLLSLGCLRMRSPRNPRGYALVAAAAVLLAALAGLAIRHASPYTSLKLMGYAAPLLTLLALATFVRRASPEVRPDGSAALRHVGGVLFSTLAAAAFVSTTVFTVGYALKWVRPATVVSGAVRAADRLPRSEAVRIDYGDAWRQSWLVYFLRDRRLAVKQPSVYLTGFSPADAAKHRTFTSPSSYVLAPTHRGRVVWRGSGGVLYRIASPSAR
jgi:hypothetical protein